MRLTVKSLYEKIFEQPRNPERKSNRATPPTRLGFEVEKQICADYMAGMKTNDIVRKYNLNSYFKSARQVVNRIIHRRGGTIRPPEERYHIRGKRGRLGPYQRKDL